MAGTIVPALLSMNAVCVSAGPGGKRNIAVFPVSRFGPSADCFLPGWVQFKIYDIGIAKKIIERKNHAFVAVRQKSTLKIWENGHAARRQR
jgi:hypothetical protein